MARRPDVEILEEELATLVTFKAYLQAKIEKLRHQIRYQTENPEIQAITNVRRSLWIPTNCLTPYVIQYLKTNTVTSLANAASVSSKTIMNIVDAETEFTSDPLAEAIFLAMGLPHIYSNLTPVRLKRIAKQAEPPPSQYFEE